MSEALPAPQQQLIAELKVTAHLMTLDAGVYCVYAGSDSAPPDPTTGLPAVRLTVPPGLLGRSVSVTSVRDDGWMGAPDAVSLIRVARGPAQILITIYQLPDSPQEPPRLQVTRLVDGIGGQTPEPQAIKAPPPQRPAAVAKVTDESTVTGGAAAPLGEPEIMAHVQIRGDVAAMLGEWVGDPDSQRWIEGFALAPREVLGNDDIEYQAVLGRGWLSPWAEGGQYCGSRGMALPILGLRVRLRGDAADTHRLEVRGTFTDGTKIGPLGAGDACEAESLAPLEAFRVTVIPIGAESPAARSEPRGGLAAKRGKLAPPPKPPAPVVKQPTPMAKQPVPAAKQPVPVAKPKPAAKPPAAPEPVAARPKPGRGKGR